MKVKISSPCMSMLVYESAKSSGQAEGCLQGEVATEVTKDITDSDVTVLSEEVLSVHSICPFRLPSSTIENNGSKETKILGWYKFCRRPLLRLSVREKSVHRKFAKSLHERNGFSPHLVTILVQERWVENQSTYLWRFAAFLQRDRWFVPCHVEVVNLKASTCGVYKPYPSVHQQHRLPQVTKALNSLSDSFFSSTENSPFHMVNTVRNSGQDVVRCLNETISKLRSTEMELETAYEEQNQLKKAVAELQDVRDVEENRSSSDRNLQLRKDFYSEITDSSEEDIPTETVEDFQTGSNDIKVFGHDSGLPERKRVDSADFHDAASTSNLSKSDKTTSSCHNDPLSSYDPSDNLGHKAKADLKTRETSQPGCSKDEDK